ncbi:LexA family protein [Longitalea luteola]|uniref:LexA family protein n=1 Tax=Longitalea luteola TaxID=2812563 RepID=UPI001A973DBC|nr:translesion error-prone DNA polymerase V autoproteolytic subunit [Longitalea luteola]
MGFPSPAKDYQEDVIDLSKYLVQHPTATFYFRVSGDSMINACMPHGSLLVVDRSIKPASGMIVLAVVSGEFTVRRLVQTRRSLVLHAENPLYKPLVVTEEMNMQVWGVVTAVVVKYKYDTNDCAG